MFILATVICKVYNMFLYICASQSVLLYLNIIIMNKYILLIVSMLFTINLFAQVDKVKSKEYFHKADSLFDLQKHELVILYCDSAIEQDAENIEAYAFRGVSKFNLNRYEEAINDFDLALILNNGYAEIYYYRGLSKLELGVKKQACEDFYEAYNLDYKEVMQVIEVNCDLKKQTEENK